MQNKRGLFYYILSSHYLDNLSNHLLTNLHTSSNIIIIKLENKEKIVNILYKYTNPLAILDILRSQRICPWIPWYLSYFGSSPFGYSLYSSVILWSR